jgi:hypothetical protein
VVGGTLGVSGVSTFTADLVATGASMSFQDDEGITLGTGSDATIKFDATNVALDTQAVGSGLLIVTGRQAISGVEIDNTATDGDPTLAFTLSGTSLFTMGVDDGDSDKFKIGTTAIGTSTSLTIDGSQNVGINQTTPTHKLHVVGDVKLQSSQIQMTDGYGMLWGTTGFNGNASTNALRFDTAGAERISVDSSGNVGINQSTPTHKLHVVGDVKLQNSQVHLTDGYGLLWGNNGFNGNDATDSLRFDTAGGARLTINSAGLVSIGNNLAVTGSVSKGSGSFKIDHPHPDLNETHHLVHSFVEGPRADLIYRGSATLVDGTAAVDLDAAAGMTAGTWVLLCRDEQVYTSNETGWKHVRGSVSGSTLTIDCEEDDCTDTISFLVIAERQDQHMIDTDWTDSEGRVITEPVKPPPDPEE